MGTNCVPSIYLHQSAVHNVWLSVGAQLSVSDFADTYKEDGPTERCEEPATTTVQGCDDKVTPHSKQDPLTSHEVIC